jgi:AcrR family transcriptional regulator
MREKEGIPSSQRLVQAAIDLWEARGAADISARLLASTADMPVSGIYYHFGDLERLFLIAQEEARAAAERWCGDRIAEISDAANLGPRALPPLLAALTHDWSRANRRLAFAWRECQIMAARDARYLPALNAWRALWNGFWQDICARCGLADAADLTGFLFDGESMLHMMRWRPTVDRACLEEICHGWGAWLGGRLASEGPWRLYAWTEARRAMPVIADKGDTARRVAEAAADVIVKRGAAQLTHRAVAAESGLTLGVVSYNFRSSADLAGAAFEMLYRRTVPLTDEEVASRPDFCADEAIAQLIGYQKSSIARPATDELMVAVARNPDLAAFVPQLRYLRGRTSRGLVQAMAGAGASVSLLDAAIFSAISTGLIRACVGLSDEEATAFFLRQMDHLKVLLAAAA